MKKFKILKIISTFIIVFQVGLIAIIFINPQMASAAYTPLNFEPQVQIPIAPFDKSTIKVGNYSEKSGIMSSSLLADYIKAIYNYSLIIGGILAAVVLMGGGVLWLTSAGNDSKIAQAKELITGSVVGLVILFSSWILLDTINPDLINMKTLKTQVINKLTYGSCCEFSDTHEAYDNISEKKCLKDNGKYFKIGKPMVDENNKGYCVDTGSCYCKIGPHLLLWTISSKCFDKINTKTNMTPDLCEISCSSAAKALNKSYQTHFIWGENCKAIKESGTW